MINHFSRTIIARRRWLRSNSGQSLVELAIALPILLGLVIGIFEFGRAWNIRQVTTNAAREGARMAVIAGEAEPVVLAAVESRLSDAGLDTGLATISINGMTCGAPSCVGLPVSVQVDYPVDFTFLGPIVDLLGGGGSIPGSINMTTTSTMRHE
jgi:Flp pilus assembly protein TadG